MKVTLRPRFGSPGFISYITVLSTGVLLLLIMLYAYKRASLSQAVQGEVQLRVDYGEKEDAILRSIVSLTPNRAIRAMQDGSRATAVANTLSWQSIFNDAIIQANARTSVDPTLRASIGMTSAIAGNVGDSSLGTVNRIFTNTHGGANTVYTTAGIQTDRGAGYPSALSTTNATVIADDATYPLISTEKVYGTLANAGGKSDVKLSSATYKNFNRLVYPNINFGYAKPGDLFVAKRNWWAFSMDLGEHDAASTSAALFRRRFVLSIYEIPSQLAISSSAFMSLGTYGAGGGNWGSNVNIQGNVFAGKAKIEGGRNLPTLATRRGVEIENGSTIGNQSFSGNPFAPGVREQYQATTGDFFPVSVPSESGRAAFIPINSEAKFFDRFANTPTTGETNTLSPTTWNNYSSGAMQCAMRLDVTEIASGTSQVPTRFRFSYMEGTGRTSNNFTEAPVIPSNTLTVPRGFALAGLVGGNTYNFTKPTDIMYGIPGAYTVKMGFTGSLQIPFLSGLTSYVRPARPFDVSPNKPGNRVCITVYPERIPEFLTAIGGNSPAGVTTSGLTGRPPNHSLVVNSDYTVNAAIRVPTIPNATNGYTTSVNDYGLIMNECANLSAFTKGFSLVTNFRLYIGGDFNTTVGVPQNGYVPTGDYYPPCSLFAPEKRYGVEANPYSISLTGQIGSLAKDDLGAANVIRPLDAKGVDDQLLTPGRNTINLRPITHPEELPPITMMNWLILLEERRGEFN